MKRMNNGKQPKSNGETPSEFVEKSPPAKGNPFQTPVTSTQGLESASSGLDRVREKARRDKDLKFTNLLHLIDYERLLSAYRALNHKAAVGVDDVTWKYDNIEHNWLMKYIEHRIADKRVLRLIKKMLKAGVSEDGQWSKTGAGTPQGAETFDFLGFTHVCSKCRMKGKFKLLRKTISKRLRSKIKEVCQTLHRHRHKPIVEQGKWLRCSGAGILQLLCSPW